MRAAGYGTESGSCRGKGGVLAGGEFGVFQDFSFKYSQFFFFLLFVASVIGDG